ncbi:uncharacterized protein LOC111112506 [Crassostrea virginica]
MAGMVLLVCCSWAVLLCLSVQAYENLALHQPAWQSSRFWSDYYGAEPAVDGLYTDLRLGGGQCAVSAGGQTTAEWRVDLGGARSIHHIVIQYMTGNSVWDENNVYTGLFLGFSMYVSNTTNKEDGVLCFRDTNYTRATIPNPVNITCPYHGRYVFYYNNRTHPPFPEGYSDDAYIRLCEVEVYGCPSPGYYWKNCSLECPQNCQGGYCDSVEGTCLDCKPEYIGCRCNEECPDGYYGKQCAGKCSLTCVVPGRCDKVTGRCLGGCQAGWTGNMCKEDCSDGHYGYNCLENCSLTCGDSGKCDKITGHCVGAGCRAGWTSDMCEKECGAVPERNCSLTCGHPGKCDRVTGHCNGGCQRGWTGVMCEEENLALHQPAWQSSTLRTDSDYYGAERAVDGLYTNLYWSGGQCAMSYYYRSTAEWRVDLGGVRSVHHIVIQYMTGNEAWDENNFYTQFFLGFSLYISNTTNKEDGVLCFRDINYTRATIPNPVNITCPYHGRYVIYYNNRIHPPYPEGYSHYAYIRLCEVEVYGCPSPGYYGENCSLECPQNCQDGYCDIVEGTCFGCAHRYIGPRCTKGRCPFLYML